MEISLVTLPRWGYGVIRAYLPNIYPINVWILLFMTVSLDSFLELDSILMDELSNTVFQRLCNYFFDIPIQYIAKAVDIQSSMDVFVQ